MPIERLQPGGEAHYPTLVSRFLRTGDGLERAHAAAQRWLDADPEHHSVNILIAPMGTDSCIFVFPRDQRRSSASGMGLVGGFEVAGDMVLSSRQEEETFLNASVAAAREILEQIRPPDRPDDTKA
jgi:hypothetical protein